MESDQIESTVFKWWLEIDNFCKGYYSDAEERTQQAWIEFFCTYMLTPLNEKVKKIMIVTTCKQSFD